MTSFKSRASPASMPELMDDPQLAPATLAACLKSLADVNRLSLGALPTVRFVTRLARRRPGPLRLLDVGSGYGDCLRVIARHAARRGITVELVGVDQNVHAVAIAQSATDPSLPVRFVEGDARDLFGEGFDAIVCSLFTHHLEDDELVAFLRMLDRAPAFLINDLYRSRAAASGFAVLARLLGRHPIVRHDGPVSFARAFRRADWERLLVAAGVTHARISIGAPYRLCVEKLP